MKETGLCIFGEVLFDSYPDGHRVLGGAPFNVAWHLQAFGHRPQLVSRVGDDAEGREIRAAMTDWGMSLDGLQTDPVRPTGRVAVVIEDGEPKYDIVPDCAYDAIDAAQLPDCECALLYHGSLALRGETTRRSLATLRSAQPSKVFLDVNLRDPWWNRGTVLEMVKSADWVKLNEHELSRLAPAEGNLSQRARDFLELHQLLGLVVTRGAKGALVLRAAGAALEIAPVGSVDVVDTVGAGDAFASAMILGITLDWPPALMVQRAQAFASHLVQHRGATVKDPEFYQSFLAQWALEGDH